MMLPTTEENVKKKITLAKVQVASNGSWREKEETSDISIFFLLNDS